MRTSMLIAIAGAVAVIAFAGAVAASGNYSSVFGTESKSSQGMGGMGGSHMHDWGEDRSQGGYDGGCHDRDWDWNYSYGDSNDGCPMNYDWNYSYQYKNSYDGCPYSD